MRTRPSSVLARTENSVPAMAVCCPLSRSPTQGSWWQTHLLSSLSLVPVLFLPGCTGSWGLTPGLLHSPLTLCGPHLLLLQRPQPRPPGLRHQLLLQADGWGAVSPAPSLAKDWQVAIAQGAGEGQT